MWYCAHAIFYYRHEVQDSFLVHENVYLIDAKDDIEAMENAKMIASEQEDLSDDGHLEVNGKKAQYIFAGIRKLIEVELDHETGRGKIHSGIEATYSVFEVNGLDEVKRLAAGKMTETLYRE